MLKRGQIERHMWRSVLCCVCLLCPHLLVYLELSSTLHHHLRVVGPCGYAARITLHNDEGDDVSATSRHTLREKKRRERMKEREKSER